MAQSKGLELIKAIVQRTLAQKSYDHRSLQKVQINCTANFYFYNFVVNKIILILILKEICVLRLIF